MTLQLQNLNKAFESKARLGIMSVLMMNESLDFATIKSLLQLSDGNIASHTRALEELGYIESEKRFIGRKPNTSYHVTKAGEAAFKEHLEALKQFIQNT